MSKSNRRDFLCYLSAAALIPLVGQEVSAKGKNLEMNTPVNGFTYTYVGGPIQCQAVVTSRRKIYFPRAIHISRIDYRTNGVVVGSGTPNSNFLFNWAVPIPSVGGDDYILRAEAIQVVTGNIIATATVSFRVIRLQG